MKKISILVTIVLITFNAIGQYDSAMRYRMVTPSFYVAMDTFISRADTVDTSGESERYTLVRFKNFMGNKVK